MPFHVCIWHTDPEEELQAELHVQNFFKSIPIKDQMVQNISNSSKHDKEMNVLDETIKNGWPEHKKQCPTEFQEYWNYRNELVTHHGILLKGD